MHMHTVTCAVKADVNRISSLQRSYGWVMSIIVVTVKAGRIPNNKTTEQIVNINPLFQKHTDTAYNLFKDLIQECNSNQYWCITWINVNYFDVDANFSFYGRIDCSERLGKVTGVNGFSCCFGNISWNVVICSINTPVPSGVLCVQQLSVCVWVQSVLQCSPCPKHFSCFINVSFSAKWKQRTYLQVQTSFFMLCVWDYGVFWAVVAYTSLVLSCMSKTDLLLAPSTFSDTAI